MYQDQDFDHLWADHLLARERALRGREEEVERDPAERLARAARSGGEGHPSAGLARGATLLRAWFR